MSAGNTLESRAELTRGYLGSFGIAPWNAPTGLAIRAIAIPLICGNTVVLKSSEECPRTHAIIVELFEEVSREGSYSHALAGLKGMCQLE